MLCNWLKQSFGIVVVGLYMGLIGLGFTYAQAGPVKPGVIFFIAIYKLYPGEKTIGVMAPIGELAALHESFCRTAGGTLIMEKSKTMIMGRVVPTLDLVCIEKIPGASEREA